MAPSATINAPRVMPQATGVSEKSNANGHVNGTRLESPSINLQPIRVSADDLFDLVCIGFGPASLAIAIALHDAYQTSPARHPKVLFLEKQARFAWHAGMQLPGAKMQISFLKDLATPRDPTSKFTFLNYLFQNGRLNNFINLGTFLPSRMEYEDYLRWCASFFEKEGCVEYGIEVNGVGIGEKSRDGKVSGFVISARNKVGDTITRRARRVVIAVGGQPVIPSTLLGLKHVHHSSQFANEIGKVQAKEGGQPLKFAVIGGGQSAAEIFNDIWSRFPGAEVRLIIKAASLRPSDDSPFVNEIFDPDRVDGIYNQDPSERAAAIALDRGTNYGVVRLELLEHLYEKLYMQNLRSSDKLNWPARILANRTVLSASQSIDSKVILKLGHSQGNFTTEELEVDYVFAATGYRRNAHEKMLSDLLPLLSKPSASSEKLPVLRDYRVQYDESRIDGSQAGIWLQGCNEETHGLSDTLLSILAVRGGELVRSIFGKPEKS